MSDPLKKGTKHPPPTLCLALVGVAENKVKYFMHMHDKCKAYISHTAPC